MSDLFAGYGVSAAARSLGVDCWDEVFSTPPDEAGAGGVARPKYRHLVDILDEMPRGELASRIEALANSYLTSPRASPSTSPARSGPSRSTRSRG